MSTRIVKVSRVGGGGTVPGVSNEHEFYFNLGRLFDSIIRRLDRIEIKINQIQGFEEQQMADLTAITQEVTENGDAVQSAIILLNDLSRQLTEAATDPAAINALAQQLDAQSQALAAAVVANTPAAPAPPA